MTRTYDEFLAWAVKEIPTDSFQELRGAYAAAAFIYKKNPGQVQNDVRERRARIQSGVHAG